MPAADSFYDTLGNLLLELITPTPAANSFSDTPEALRLVESVWGKGNYTKGKNFDVWQISLEPMLTYAEALTRLQAMTNQGSWDSTALELDMFNRMLTIRFYH